MTSPVKKRKRNQNFRIEFAGNEEQKQNVLQTFQKIRSELTLKLNKPIGNFQVIEHLFELWFDKSNENNYDNLQKKNY